MEDARPYTMDARTLRFLSLVLCVGCSARSVDTAPLDAATVDPDVKTADDVAADDVVDVAPPLDRPATPDVVRPVDARDVVTVVDRPVVDVPSSSGDPATRAEADVCARWNADVRAVASLPGWSMGASQCDTGTLPAATREGAVRFTNTYRWLAGLAPVPTDTAHEPAAQACAVLILRNGMLNHTPPMTWTCFSSLGYDGTSHSNIMGASGFSASVPTSIQGWIDDDRDITMTLGHRRWMLFPPLGSTAYGQAGGFACLYVLGGARMPRGRSWVAWPNAGFVPLAAASRIWSISSPDLGLSSSTRVTVTRDGASVPVTASLRTSGYGDDTVSWMMPAAVAGSVYAVEVSGLRGANLRYEVRPTACR